MPFLGFVSMLQVLYGSLLLYKMPLQGRGLIDWGEL